MGFSTMVFAYLGPETMLPMTSVVAGVVGVAMLLGRNSLRWASGMARGLVSKIRPGSRSEAKKVKAKAGPRKIGEGPSRRIAKSARDRAQS